MTSPFLIHAWRASVLGLWLAAGVLGAHAQTTSARVTASPQAGDGERDAVKWFNLLDANGDGRISMQEARIAFRLKPSLQAQFRATDSNHDGYLTADEIRAAAQRKRAERAAQKLRAQTAPDAARRSGG